MNCVVWGSRNSWIVYLVDAGGRIVWCCYWVSTREVTEAIKWKLDGQMRRASYCIRLL